MKKLLVIFLSGLAVSCKSGDFADKPSGWNCSYGYFENSMEQTGFYCNDMRTPSLRKFIHFTDPLAHKGRMMPQKDAERYEDYITDKYNALKNKPCN
ncbi:hypothetical protein D3C87_124980 [compost metagenome]